MSDDQTGGETAKIIAPPPVLFTVALGLGLLLDAFAPLVARDAWPGWVRFGLGGGLAALALGLGLWAIVAFKRAGTSPEPWHPTTALVTTGLYARIRNPMYVALVLLLTGIGLLSGGAWLLLLVPVLGAVLHLGVVRPEERYLAGRFGDAYRAYRSRAPRYGWPGPRAERGRD